MFVFSQLFSSLLLEIPAFVLALQVEFINLNLPSCFSVVGSCQTSL
jgi:hypothetical protein